MAIADIDTRKLTRILREKGAQNGCLVAAAALADRDAADAVARAQAAPSMAGQDLAKVVSCKTPYEWTESTWALGAGSWCSATRSVLSSSGCRVATPLR